jgi:hypothetical protein
MAFGVKQHFLAVSKNILPLRKKASAKCSLNLFRAMGAEETSKIKPQTSSIGRRGL